MKTISAESIPPDLKARQFLEALDFSEGELVVEQNGEPRVVLMSAKLLMQRRQAKDQLFALLDRFRERNPSGDSDALLAELEQADHPERLAMTRAVIDANVAISGTILPLGASATVLRAWRGGDLEIVTCPAIIAEIAEKLRLPRIRNKYPVSDSEIDTLLRLFASVATLVPGEALVDPLPPDPHDTMLFAAALEADADYIVTGDKALLGFTWPGRARVLTPRQFVEQVLAASRKQP